jgi:RHS repeat-associated protein
MEMPSRSFQSGSGYRYGAQGQEKVEEIKGDGNSYDFGARMQDSRTGRFLSVDSYTSTTPGESPYSFAGNSPIRFVDMNGNFRIDAFFVMQYPTLAKMVQYYLPMLKDNPDVRKAWISVTGFTGAEFDKWVTYGEGPWVTPKRPELSDNFNYFNQNDPRAIRANGQFSPLYPQNLFISNDRLEELEGAMKVALAGGNAEEVRRRMFFVSVAIMHEFSHYGVFHKLGQEAAQNVDLPHGTDQGSVWERRAFTQFSYLGSDEFGDAPDMNVFNSFYKNKLNEVGSIGMTLSPRSSYNTMIFRNKTPTRGQVGDPSVEPNERKKSGGTYRAPKHR